MMQRPFGSATAPPFGNGPLFTTTLSFLSSERSRGICGSTDLSWESRSHLLHNRGVQRLAYDRLRFLFDLLQVLLAAKTFGVDLVNFLRP
jgi:hypothetical protein